MIEDVPYSQIFNLDYIERERYYAIGESYMRNQTIAFITLAGGMGTRLGLFGTKALYVTPLGKTLVQIYAERLEMLKQKFNCNIIWYVFVSQVTNEQIHKYFELHDDFGFDVHFIIQENCKCKDFEGNYIHLKDRLASSPNGTGGLYQSLHKFNVIKYLEDHNVKYIQVCNIDNINCLPLDPISIGIMEKNSLQFLCKGISLKPNQQCGLFCLKDEKPHIVEYFEVDDSTRNILRFGNIGNYFYGLEYLKTCVKNYSEMELHRVKKKIPYFDVTKNMIITPEKPNGYKYEYFIFDLLHHCQLKHFGVHVVDELFEYAPIKNNKGEHSPDFAFNRFKKHFTGYYFDNSLF